MHAGVVGALVQVARTAQKEKVFRVAILSLRNLLNHDELGLASDMVAAGLGKVVATRQMQVGRRWAGKGGVRGRNGSLGKW
jgi:V-type H+-transporting ATPase subunit H